MLILDEPDTAWTQQPWVDIQFAQSGLFVFDQALAGERWAHIAVAGAS